MTSGTMTRQEFLLRCGARGETLELWLAQSWIAPREPDGFSEADLARARLIGELTRDLGVNEAGIDVILHLIDQVHGLRRALGELRAAP